MANQVASWIRTARVASWWLTKNDFYWPDYAVEEEIVRRAAEYSENGVNTVVLFGLHFRWDYVPYFERIRALFRRIVAECHKHNIRVCDHYSDTLIHRPRNEDDRWFIRERLNHHVAIYPDYDQDYVFEGSPRNSWRQVDARTGEAAYYDGYRCQMFCPNNPDYQRASATYARRQFEEAGIDGMMNDDLHFLPRDLYSCACEHCRRRFKDEFGRDLPPAGDKEFWGNRRNPAFRDWLAMRLRSNGDHYVRLRKTLGPERPLFGCCSSMDRQHTSDVGCVHDEFSRGLNVVSMEMMPRNLIVEWGPLFGRQSIYQAVAAAGDYLRGEAASVMEVAQPDPFIAVAYSRTPEQFFMAWALVTAWGGRSWICKDTQTHDVQSARAVYDDRSHLARSLKWETAHEELYVGAKSVADVAVVFSPSTRNFCSPDEAETHRRQLVEWMRLMAENGILSEALLAQGLRGAEAGRLLAMKRPALILPCVAALSDEEFEGIAAYLEAGGNVIIAGELGRYTESGEERPAPLLERIKERSAQARGELCCLPKFVVEQASPGDSAVGQMFREPAGRADSVERCLQTLRQCLPNPTLQPASGAAGWTFHLYEKAGTFLLHCLNLSGTIPVDGQEIPDDASLEYPVPPSGIIECRLKAGEAEGLRAQLYSPDGAEGVPVEMSREGDYTHLRIPVKDASHYGIVVMEETP